MAALVLAGMIAITMVATTEMPAYANTDPTTCGTPGGPHSTAYNGQINIINVKTNPKYANFNHGPNWEVSGTYPETLSISHSLSYTNTYSSTVTVSSGTVSSALGFSVAKSISTQVGATFPVPNDGKYWVLRAGTQDFPITFDVQLECSGTDRRVIGHGSAVKTGRVITRNIPSS